jgi:hypothetical protein
VLGNRLAGTPVLGRSKPTPNCLPRRLRPRKGDTEAPPTTPARQAPRNGAVVTQVVTHHL